jgi:hypothetical protein
MVKPHNKADEKCKPGHMQDFYFSGEREQI